MKRLLCIILVGLCVFGFDMFCKKELENKRIKGYQTANIVGEMDNTYYNDVATREKSEVDNKIDSQLKLIRAGETFMFLVSSLMVIKATKGSSTSSDRTKTRKVGTYGREVL